MTRPTFDEALADDGPKVAAWELSPRDGRSTISVFSLASGGAVQVAWRSGPTNEVEGLTAALRASGHLVGEYDEHCDLVWVASKDEVTVWSETEKVLVADAAGLRLSNGKTFARDAFEAFRSFVDEELYIDRGVRGRTPSGELIEVVYEPKWGAGADPTYNRNDLIWETGWTGEIAKALAVWGDADYESWLLP